MALVQRRLPEIFPILVSSTPQEVASVSPPPRPWRSCDFFRQRTCFASSRLRFRRPASYPFSIWDNGCHGKKPGHLAGERHVEEMPCGWESAKGERRRSRQPGAIAAVSSETPDVWMKTCWSSIADLAASTKPWRGEVRTGPGEGRNREQIISGGFTHDVLGRNVRQWALGAPQCNYCLSASTLCTPFTICY